MSASGWERTRRSKNSSRVDAKSIPIGPIVSHYGGEVREGKNVSVRCCMHNDTRRSAVINTVDNLIFCHTCGKGGNAVNVVQAIENMEFKDALNRALEIVTRSGQPLRGSGQRANTRVSKRTWNL